MAYKVAQAAKKALSLDYSGANRLLLLMTIMLCWLIAVGAASITIFSNVYQVWQLNQQGQISLYLLPSSDDSEIQNLQEKLVAFPAVSAIQKLDQHKVQSLLQPYFQTTQAFPLPVVLVATVKPNIDRQKFDALVHTLAPTAEIDDNRAMLQVIAKTVNLSQWGIFVFSVILMGIMSLLVILTVRTGLREQKKALSILQFLGGTDAFLTNLIVRQIVLRSLLGWGIALCIAIAIVVCIAFIWPFLGNLLTPQVWLVLFFTPLLLPIIAWVTASTTAYSIVQKS